MIRKTAALSALLLLGGSSASAWTVTPAPRSSAAAQLRHGPATVASAGRGTLPGVLRFAPQEVGGQMPVYPATVAALYPASLSWKRDGHLVVVKLTSGRLIGVVQPDSTRFTLHAGERVIYVESAHGAWHRVLPYSGPGAKR